MQLEASHSVPQDPTFQPDVRNLHQLPASTQKLGRRACRATGQWMWLLIARLKDRHFLIQNGKLHATRALLFNNIAVCGSKTSGLVCSTNRILIFFLFFPPPSLQNEKLNSLSSELMIACLCYPKLQGERWTIITQTYLKS